MVFGWFLVHSQLVLAVVLHWQKHIRNCMDSFAIVVHYFTSCSWILTCFVGHWIGVYTFTWAQFWPELDSTCPSGQSIHHHRITGGKKKGSGKPRKPSFTLLERLFGFPRLLHWSLNLIHLVRSLYPSMQFNLEAWILLCPRGSSNTKKSFEN